MTDRDPMALTRFATAVRAARGAGVTEAERYAVVAGDAYDVGLPRGDRPLTEAQVVSIVPANLFRAEWAQRPLLEETTATDLDQVIAEAFGTPTLTQEGV